MSSLTGLVKPTIVVPGTYVPGYWISRLPALGGQECPRRVLTQGD